MTTLRIAPCNQKAAKYAVEHWHYSRCLPAPKLIRFGVWEGGAFIGVVIFSRGATNTLGRMWGCTQLESCELTRVALRQHAAPVSEIVANALRELRRTNPGLRLVISFADPMQSHHGGIYQAGNWVYTGQTSPDVRYRDRRTGKLYHPRVCSTSGYAIQFGVRKRVAKRSECDELKVPGKHRYLMPLDKQTRRRISKHALPYPPRAAEVSTATRPGSAEEMQVQFLPAAQL